MGPPRVQSAWLDAGEPGLRDVTPTQSTAWSSSKWDSWHMSNKQSDYRPPPLTCSVRFTQADLGDAARVTLRSSPLQHTVLLQPIRWCHGENKTATRDWKGRSPSAKVTGIKRWCGLNVVGVLQLQLLVPEKQQRWGNPLRAQHHGAFRCCSQKSATLTGSKWIWVVNKTRKAQYWFKFI